MGLACAAHGRAAELPGGLNEIGDGDLQALQARRGARCTDRAWHPGPDGQRSEGLRPAEGPDRDLSRRRICRELPAQGQNRSGDRGRAGRAHRRCRPQGCRHRQDRRRQDLRHTGRAGRPHPHRRVRRRRSVILVGERPMIRSFRSTLPAAATGAALVLLPAVAFADDKLKIDSADTAWMLTSTALVLMMTIPGLALFYGGMVRKKNVLATVAQSFAVVCLVTVLWLVLGYSLAFTAGSTILGGVGRVFMAGMTVDSISELAKTIPESVYMCFQLTFAIITPALIAGAFAERMKFSAMLWFMSLWSLV